MSKLFDNATLNIDRDDPLQVACAWSSIIEPGDPAAGILRAYLGPVKGLEWIVNSFSYPPSVEVESSRVLEIEGELNGQKIPWKRCHARWNPRVNELQADKDLARIKQIGGELIAPDDSRWPIQLKDLGIKEPVALWIIGEGKLSRWGWNEPSNETNRVPSMAIVGARASTPYGNRSAQRISCELVEKGIQVISGGAYGIDTAAHQGALAAHMTVGTVAVLCGGLGNLYPRGNTELFKAIVDNGVLISEVPPHWRPARWRFLERNRLIAALSMATIVVEAGIRSGATATANRALELGRQVGAVPGPITSAVSSGCHQLIKDGAMLVESSDDILELIGMKTELPENSGFPTDKALVGNLSEAQLTKTQQIIWAAMPRKGNIEIGQIVTASGLSRTEVESDLLQFQLCGLVVREGNRWKRRFA